MVKRIVLKGDQLRRREQAHLYLAETMGFPDYYGKNMDALFDCLTELTDCTIVLEGGEELRRSGDYGAKVLRVLEEAAAANPGLELEFPEAQGTAAEPHSQSF